MEAILSTAVHPEWQSFFNEQISSPYWTDLFSFLVTDSTAHTIYPPTPQILRIFRELPPSKITCILLGQDPYHGPNQANGLSFSVNQDQKLPPSLRNIFKEYHTDLQLPLPASGDLSPWLQNGVFLLNTVLTVRAGQAQSHAKRGWETFTSNALLYALTQNPQLGFLCFGTPATKTVQKTLAQLSFPETEPPTVISTPHPSPLSAYRGFFGSKPFTSFNYEQEKKGRKGVNWELPSNAKQQQTKLF